MKHNSRFGNFSWKGHLGSNVLAFHLVRIQTDKSILDRRYTINPALADKSEGGGGRTLKGPPKSGGKTNDIEIPSFLILEPFNLTQQDMLYMLDDTR